MPYSSRLQKWLNQLSSANYKIQQRNENDAESSLGLFLIAAALGGCVRKMDVEQGNILTPDMISRVHKGMSIQQVREDSGNTHS